MKTITVNLYQFSELSEDAKEKVIENFRDGNTDFWFLDEVRNSFDKFCDLFSIKWSQIDYQEPYRNEYSIQLDDCIKELSGQRLATYIWNNYKNDLFKRKYLKSFDGHKKHINIVNHTAKGTRKEYCNYYSSLKKDNSCVLTGVCYDYDLLQPIYDFLDKPTDTDFETLLNDCIYSLCHSVSSEIDYQNSDEAITETIEANEYYFDEDGNLN